MNIPTLVNTAIIIILVLLNLSFLVVITLLTFQINVMQRKIKDPYYAGIFQFRYIFIIYALLLVIFSFLS